MQPMRCLPKKSFLYRTLLLLVVSASANAADKGMTNTVNIPVIEGARIFAQFDEKTPAVLNYFTAEPEDDVIAFYNKSYGEPVESERKRGRLTLNYQQELQKIRVVISQQNKLRQVDVIVDSRAATIE